MLATAIPASAFAETLSTESGGFEVSAAASNIISNDSKSSTSSTSKKSAKRKKKSPKMTRTKLLKRLGKVTGSRKLKTFCTRYKLKSTEQGRRLIRYVRKLKKRYKLAIVMIDLRTGQGFSVSAKRKIYSASCLKGPYVASLNKWKPKSRRSSSYMRQTIVVSNNDTYKALRIKYGSSTMRKMLAYSKVSSFDYTSRYTFVPPRDLARLWVGTYWYFYRNTNRNSKWCRSLYTHGRQSFIYQSMKGKRRVYAKPGWYPGARYNVQNDSGIVMSKVKTKTKVKKAKKTKTVIRTTSCPYVITVMSTAYGKLGTLSKLVRLCDSVHTSMMKRYLKTYRLS
ncbi:MAG: hypothetical protein ACOX69_07230 [Coriobacteriales bacterium]